MKRLKQSLLIHIWEETEFYLSIPKSFKGTNKPFIFFYYYNSKTNKSERIRRYLGKNRGDVKKVQEEAKSLVNDLVKLLQANWNPINDTINKRQINLTSNISECIEYWLLKREEAFNSKSIGHKMLKNNKILMNHFSSYLISQKISFIRVSALTNVHIKEFLDLKAFERGWGKVTYNTYLVDLGSFFNYLKDLKIINENPCSKVSKKNIKFDASRFKVYEKEELQNVATLLLSDKRYSGLFLATKLLYKYNIRPLEITRMQIQDIDFNKELLTLDGSKTKNKNEARFKLDQETLDLIKDMCGSYDPEFFLFGGRNKPGENQVCAEYFGQCWRYFRMKHNISCHLKLYALKHTSNYYDIEAGANFEEIRQRNRHANLQITTLYIKERLFKNEIKASTQNLF